MGGRTRKAMAKMDASDEKTLKAIVDSITVLYQRHVGEISRIREGSEQNIIGVTFAVTDDRSDVEPVIKTKIGFNERHTDNVTARLGSPDQEQFTFDEPGVPPQDHPEDTETRTPKDEPAKGKKPAKKKAGSKSKETAVSVPAEPESAIG